MKECRLRALLERLAALEHEQWMSWAGTIMKQEKLSEERLRRWLSYMVPYEQLPEDVKEYDREWARKVLEVIKEFLTRSMEDRGGERGCKGCRLSLQR